ncbi:MAG: transcriptional regulator [Bacteroidetes bacterium]|nr:MAG: transcriptional regulator [Bacteroidota bacterium]
MSNNECIRVFADKDQIMGCKTDMKNSKKFISELAGVFNLAGNDVRLSILYLLQQEERLCVCDISDILEMQIPAIAQHLRKMKDGNVIEKNRVGAMVYYSMRPEAQKLLNGFFRLITNESLLKTKAA